MPLNCFHEKKKKNNQKHKFTATKTEDVQVGVSLSMCVLVKCVLVYEMSAKPTVHTQKLILYMLLSASLLMYASPQPPAPPQC